MQPQNNSGWFLKLLRMALLGLFVVAFAGPIAVVLGLALVGYLAVGAFRLMAGGTGTFRTLTEEAGNFSRKLLNGIGWAGERVGRALASVAGLGTRLVGFVVRGVFGLGALAIRLASGGLLGAVLGAVVWSFFSFDPITIAAGALFGTVVGAVAGLGSGRNKPAVEVTRQPAHVRV